MVLALPPINYSQLYRLTATTKIIRHLCQSRVDQFPKRPHMICKAERHSGRHVAVRFMDAAKIVVSNIQAHSRFMVF